MVEDMKTSSPERGCVTELLSGGTHTPLPDSTGAGDSRRGDRAKATKGRHVRGPQRGAEECEEV